MVECTQALAQEFYIRLAEAGREKLADIQKSLSEFDHSGCERNEGRALEGRLLQFAPSL